MAALTCAKEIVDNGARIDGDTTCSLHVVAYSAATGHTFSDETVRAWKLAAKAVALAMRLTVDEAPKE